MIHNLVYMSKAVHPMQKADLLNILEQSRSWNKSHEITGMLFYIQGEFLNTIGGRFIQVLEGPEDAVNDIFNKIKRDERHHNLVILHESSIVKRNFEGWKMGFKSLDKEVYKMLPGWFELNDNCFNMKELKKFNLPVSLLKSFYSMNEAGLAFR